jgi:peptidoglycan/xylan/chitin deacetylase (PgdA/CDA1 family)
VTLLAVIAIVGMVWFVPPHLLKMAQVTHLRDRCHDGRLVVLTYDDGPGRNVTATVMSVLLEYQATATFFVLGQKLSENSALIEQLIAAGHELGSHSYNHLHAWKRDPVSIMVDAQKGLAILRSVAKCQSFRAPYGKLTFGVLIQMWAQGCRQAWWTIDSTDTRETPSSIDTILQKVRKDGGGVILMHDLDRPNKPEHEKFVIELTRALLELARSEGFKVCSFREVYR